MADLEAIRERRMQELMAQHGGGAGGGAQSAEQQEQQEEQRQQAEEQRRSMLVAVMTSEARERLSRIALVKPEKARGIENLIISMAQRGQLSEKVSEERLKGLLEQIQEKQGGTSGPKITIQRRRAFDEDD
mmetsp:Transcript_11364/g.19913  ORF Transcript_11364/g.19913 Transcript_11364/m.19913 type:complete len:131 (-) Transcript_11364:480-872(-)|eukprot:CAMPEP_0119101154 /NCGR_PEP_ID=MMETSP1180-20130426/278_1 /TAXON_ID=3052 ORGANISM="Chlamydomonas cf sp, Strain CCMP681" /NCGR_SAMPLE_ID=MMETSP1180 /ASSEMBLY_ACC=CAM_ASM_000741 /LENGTH=130 /DNA_ID=CAMNT_0007085221 /DNA_START=42 /DNA_END=434 /DNA_ORIENTATION=+